MIITTSASTVTTVTYLSLYDLKNYKKQFQSFWIPFMEQFIPATTVWVAGERWCNDVCTIIDPCDYDFELVESEVSYEEVPAGFYPLSQRVASKITVPIPVSSQVGSGTVAKATKLLSTPLITPVSDLGLTTTTPIIKTTTEANVDISSYRLKFTKTVTKVI